MLAIQATRHPETAPESGNISMQSIHDTMKRPDIALCRELTVGTYKIQTSMPTGVEKGGIHTHSRILPDIVERFCTCSKFPRLKFQDSRLCKASVPSLTEAQILPQKVESLSREFNILCFVK